MIFVPSDRLARALLRSLSAPRLSAAPIVTQFELLPGNQRRWGFGVSHGSTQSLRAWPDNITLGAGIGWTLVTGNTALATFNLWQHGPWVSSMLWGWIAGATTVYIVEYVFQSEDYADLIGSQPLPLGTPAALGGPTECVIPGAHIPMPSGRDPTRRRNDP